MQNIYAYIYIGPVVYYMYHVIMYLSLQYNYVITYYKYNIYLLYLLYIVDIVYTRVDITIH